MIIGVDLGMVRSSYCGVWPDLRLARVNEWPNTALERDAARWAQGARLVVLERVDAEIDPRAMRGYAMLKEWEERITAAVADQGILILIAGKAEIRARIGGYHPKHCGAAKLYCNHWLSGMPIAATAYHGRILPRERTPDTPVPVYRTGRGSDLNNDDRRDALFCALFGWLTLRDEAQSGVSGGDAKAFHVKHPGSSQLPVVSSQENEDRRIA